MKTQRKHIGTSNKLRVISTNGTHGAHQGFSVEPGESYTFEIDLHRPAGMNKEINVVIWKNTGPSGALSVHVLNVDGTNTFTYNATSSDIFIQIRQAGTYYLDNIRMYRTYEDTVFVRGYEVDRAYRYGFNTQERVDEIAGKGNHYTAEFWEYSPRLGRRWEIDPIVKPHLSGYSVLSNNPILMIDPNGDDDYEFNKSTGKLTVVNGTQNDGPDRIISGKAKYNKDGELKNLKFQVLELDGKIENLENSWGSDSDGKFDYQTYTFSDSKDGDKTFEFMARKSNIEISKTEYQFDNGDMQTRLYTSGSPEEIRGEYLYLRHKLIKENPSLKLISQTHNHGNPGGGRLGSYNPSPDDKNFAYKVSILFNTQDTKPKFYIWRFGTETQYDEK